MPERHAVSEGVPPEHPASPDPRKRDASHSDTASSEAAPLLGDAGASRALSVDWSSGSEEPWEAQISSLLSSLPPVEPPPGFLESLAMNGPRITAPFTLEVDSPFSFPVIENDAD